MERSVRGKPPRRHEDSVKVRSRTARRRCRTSGRHDAQGIEFRYTKGVTPLMRRNAVVNELCEKKPHCADISTIEMRGFSRSRHGRSIRRTRTYRYGVSPVVCLKARAK